MFTAIDHPADDGTPLGADSLVDTGALQATHVACVEYSSSTSSHLGVRTAAALIRDGTPILVNERVPIFD